MIAPGGVTAVIRSLTRPLRRSSPSDFKACKRCASRLPAAHDRLSVCQCNEAGLPSLHQAGQGRRPGAQGSTPDAYP
eukprot:764265-Hanusia_phi.AAC.2